MNWCNEKGDTINKQMSKKVADKLKQIIFIKENGQYSAYKVCKQAVGPEKTGEPQFEYIKTGFKYSFEKLDRNNALFYFAFSDNVTEKCVVSYGKYPFFGKDLFTIQLTNQGIKVFSGTTKEGQSLDSFTNRYIIMKKH